MKVNVIMINCGGGQWDIQMSNIPRIGEKLILKSFLNGKDEKQCKSICDKLRDNAGKKGYWYEMTVKDVRYTRHKRDGDYVQLSVMLEF